MKCWYLLQERRKILRSGEIREQKFWKILRTLWVIEATNDTFMCPKLPRNMVSCYVDVDNVCGLQFPRLEHLRFGSVGLCVVCQCLILPREMWFHIVVSFKFLCVYICMKRPYPAGSIQLHIKQSRATSVLGWVTSRERVVSLLFPYFCSNMTQNSHNLIKTIQ